MKYDDALNPPGLIVDIVVRSLAAPSRSVQTRAKLDTGAGITVIPPSIVEELQLESQGMVVMVAYDDTATERETYLVTLEFLGYVFETARVAVAPRGDMLIGRDILNRFVMTLDGKAQTFEMVDL